MDRRGLLQKGALRVHHQWPGSREIEHGQVGRCLAGDGHLPMRFAGGMSTELQQHRWPHVAVGAHRRGDQRWVVENDGGWMPAPWFRRFERQLHWDACGGDSPLKQWHGDLAYPLLELAVGGLTAPFGLARVDCRRQVDIRPEVLNVDGEVDVLREAVNQPMGLGEGGSALEGEGLPRFSGQLSGPHGFECTGVDELLLVVDRAEVANR
jgi:hypothetical protein